MKELKKVIKIYDDHDTRHFLDELSELGLSLSRNEAEAKGKNKISFWSYNYKYYLGSDHAINDSIIEYVKDILNNENFYYIELYKIKGGGFLEYNGENLGGLYIPEFDSVEVLKNLIYELCDDIDNFSGFIIDDEAAAKDYIIKDIKRSGFKVLKTEKVEKIKL